MKTTTRMKSLISSLGITLLLLSTPASAIEEFSVGIAAFKPTGLSFKLWTSRLTAFDLVAGWNIDAEEYKFHADYLSHNYEMLDAKETNMIFYSGYGVRAEDDADDDEDAALGLRLPFGVTYLMDDPQIDLFGEVAPRINVTPRTTFGLDIILGIRYRIGAGHQSLE
jgi:hypothetical protein